MNSQTLYELECHDQWQTKARGSDRDEYEIYLACADDGHGIDTTTGLPLRTFEEWLQS